MSDFDELDLALLDMLYTGDFGNSSSKDSHPKKEDRMPFDQLADEVIAKPASPAELLEASRKRDAQQREFWELL